MTDPLTIEEIREQLSELECELIRKELERNNWNQSATARSLDCGLTTLRRITERHPSLMAELKKRGLPQGRPANAE